MKAVILAGGLGTRISEETSVKPKPMVEIGQMPILWHIMKIYASHGVKDFVVCCGYKGSYIKDYFNNYVLHRSTVRFDFAKDTVEYLDSDVEDWSITLVDTGEKTMTGGRIKRARKYIGEEPFYLTYGDGVSDVDLTKLRDFHAQKGTLVTLTAVQPPGRFGAISLGAQETKIKKFQEKPEGDGAWINGGFFVVDPKAIDYIEGDGENTPWEQEPLTKIAENGELSAFKHLGYWQPMDTLRDKNDLETRWQEGNAPWKVWND